MHSRIFALLETRHHYRTVMVENSIISNTSFRSLARRFILFLDACRTFRVFSLLGALYTPVHALCFPQWKCKIIYHFYLVEKIAHASTFLYFLTFSTSVCIGVTTTHLLWCC